MNLDRLREDWRSDPCLKFAAFDRVEDLAEHLVKLHRRLIGPEGGLAGYLYRQQIRRIRELEHDKRE